MIDEQDVEQATSLQLLPREATVLDRMVSAFDIKERSYVPIPRAEIKVRLKDELENYITSPDPDVPLFTLIKSRERQGRSEQLEQYLKDYKFVKSLRKKEKIPQFADEYTFAQLRMERFKTQLLCSYINNVYTDRDKDVFLLKECHAKNIPLDLLMNLYNDVAAYRILSQKGQPDPIIASPLQRFYNGIDFFVNDVPVKARYIDEDRAYAASNWQQSVNIAVNYLRGVITTERWLDAFSTERLIQTLLAATPDQIRNALNIMIPQNRLKVISAFRTALSHYTETRDEKQVKRVVLYVNGDKLFARKLKDLANVIGDPQFTQLYPESSHYVERGSECVAKKIQEVKISR